MGRIIALGALNPVREVLLVTGAMAAWLFAVDRAAWLPWLAPHAGALVAAGFLGLPLLASRRRRGQGDVLGLDGPLPKAAAWALATSLVILPPFALAYHLLQVQVLGAVRGAGPGLASPGLEFQEDAEGLAGRLIVSEDRQGVAVDNRTPRPVRVQPDVGLERTVAPGGRLHVPRGTARTLTFRDASGQAVQPPPVAASGAEMAPPIDITPGHGWLAWLLAAQLLVIGVPEEAFFRGYVLGRLRTVWPPQRRLFGVPFGQAHVLSAGLFALIHLVAVPHPARLLVFFPGLLFAWLAERTQGALAPAGLHALCNVALRVLQRLYS